MRTFCRPRTSDTCVRFAATSAPWCGFADPPRGPRRSPLAGVRIARKAFGRLRAAARSLMGKDRRREGRGAKIVAGRGGRGPPQAACAILAQLQSAARRQNEETRNRRRSQQNNPQGADLRVTFSQRQKNRNDPDRIRQGVEQRCDPDEFVHSHNVTLGPQARAVFSGPGR